MDILNMLFNLLLRFGYPVIFLGVMAQNVAILVPGQTILLAAGFFAAQGYFNLTAVTVLGSGAALIPVAAGLAKQKEIGIEGANRESANLFSAKLRKPGGAGVNGIESSSHTAH